MTNLDKDILEDFVQESKEIVEDLLNILEQADGDFTKVRTLEDYGQKVDRIMGGAKGLGQLADEKHPIHWVADYSAVCKAVGYKSSQIVGQEDFYNICVALLLDATENLMILINNLDSTTEEIKQILPQTFLDRLQWVAQKFSADYRMSVAAAPEAKQKPMDQSEIDILMKKLGIG